MKYRMVKVKKAGGGHRMQRAMVKANGQLKFVKNTHRGSGTSHKKARKHVARKHRKSTAITHRRKHHRTHRRGRRRGGGGGMPLIPIALGAAGLAYLTGPQGPKQVSAFANKIPGSKSFGPLVTLGGIAWGVDKLGIYKSKWLRLAGVVAVTAAAIKVGTAGSSFKWVGDDDIGDYDLADVDDMGDIGAEGDDGELGDDDLSDADD